MEVTRRLRYSRITESLLMVGALPCRLLLKVPLRGDRVSENSRRQKARTIFFHEVRWRSMTMGQSNVIFRAMHSAHFIRREGLWGKIKGDGI